MMGAAKPAQPMSAAETAILASVEAAICANVGAKAPLVGKSFMSQVVAGTNYFIELTDADGATFHARIFKGFDGVASLHSSKSVSGGATLAYF